MRFNKLNSIHSHHLSYHAVLPGVEVVGRVTVVVTNSPQSFHWDGYGFILHIPKNSLPAGLTQCTLDVIASLAGQYLLPNNHQMVSPAYWVRPYPFCTFQKPLSLEIQHCAKVTSTTELIFIRAVCTQEKLPYEFSEVKEKGSFSEQSLFGSLQVYSFSGYGVAGKHEPGEEVEKLYFASSFSRSLQPLIASS